MLGPTKLMGLTLRAQTAASVMESETGKTAAENVPFEVEVHDLVDDPVLH